MADMTQKQISTDPSRSEYAHIVIDSMDNKHIFWQEGRKGSPLGGAYWYGDIFYTKLDSQGNVMVDQKALTTLYSCYCQISVAVDSQNNLHMAWTDGRLHAPSLYQYSNWEVYYIKMDNNGNALTGDIRLTDAVYFSGTPYLTVDQWNQVHIVWGDLRNRNEFPGYWPTDIYYSKLDCCGNILVNNKRLTADYSGSGWPSIAVDSEGNIHMVHFKKDYIFGPDNRRVYYSKMDNEGNLLIPETQIGPIQSAAPDIAVDSRDHLHIIWMGTQSANEADPWTVYYRKQDKNGAVLVSDKALCPGNMISVTVGPGDIVYVAAIAYGNDLYYYKLGPDGDIIFDNNGLPVDTASRSYINMANMLAVDSLGDGHMVWAKPLGANTEVFYLYEKDVVPPVIHGISANPSVLWPPNHRMKPVTLVVSASDDRGGECFRRITGVTSNEPVNGKSDGNTSPDWEITGHLTLNLRAQRSGKGNGRIYTITVTCSDAAGNSTTGDVTVTVPHHRGKK